MFIHVWRRQEKSFLELTKPIKFIYDWNNICKCDKTGALFGFLSILFNVKSMQSSLDIRSYAKLNLIIAKRKPHKRLICSYMIENDPKNPNEQLEATLPSCFCRLFLKENQFQTAQSWCLFAVAIVMRAPKAFAVCSPQKLKGCDKTQLLLFL